MHIVVGISVAVYDLPAVNLNLGVSAYDIISFTSVRNASSYSS
jgi:hypothetical protein